MLAVGDDEPTWDMAKTRCRRLPPDVTREENCRGWLTPGFRERSRLCWGEGERTQRLIARRRRRVS